MKISTLQSLIRRNANEIHNTELQVDFYTKDADGASYKLYKNDRNYVGKLKKDIAKLAAIQKELKAEIAHLIKCDRDLQMWIRNDHMFKGMFGNYVENS